jgi:uncharacterized protein YlzI (FlbEa/FlbD family)
MITLSNKGEKILVNPDCIEVIYKAPEGTSGSTIAFIGGTLQHVEESPEEIHKRIGKLKDLQAISSHTHHYNPVPPASLPLPDFVKFESSARTKDVANTLQLIEDNWNPEEDQYASGEMETYGDKLKEIIRCRNAYDVQADELEAELMKTREELEAAQVLLRLTQADLKDTQDVVASIFAALKAAGYTELSPYVDLVKACIADRDAGRRETEVLRKELAASQAGASEDRKSLAAYLGTIKKSLVAAGYTDIKFYSDLVVAVEDCIADRDAFGAEADDVESQFFALKAFLLDGHALSTVAAKHESAFVTPTNAVLDALIEYRDKALKEAS